MQTDSSRRQWLGMAIAGGVAASAGFARSRIKPVPPAAPGSPHDALELLYAGNVAATENIASLEFAADALGVKVLYVLGHTSCGAVAAAAVRENVKIQAQTLVESSTVISSLVSAGKVTVAGGIFDLRSGHVEPVELPFLKG